MALGWDLQFGGVCDRGEFFHSDTWVNVFRIFRSKELVDFYYPRPIFSGSLATRRSVVWSFHSFFPFISCGRSTAIRTFGGEAAVLFWPVEVFSFDPTGDRVRAVDAVISSYMIPCSLTVFGNFNGLHWETRNYERDHWYEKRNLYQLLL